MLVLKSEKQARQTLDQLVRTLGSPTPLEALRLPESSAPPSQQLLARHFQALKDEVTALSGFVSVRDIQLLDVRAKLEELEKRIVDPLECFVLARMHLMRADANARAQLEATFLEAHVPNTVWLIAESRGDSDLRGAARQPLLTEVELTCGDESSQCRTENVSRTGVCLCRVQIDVPLGKSVALAMPLPGVEGTLVVHARVVWTRGDRVGAAFVDVTPALQEAIDGALRRNFHDVHGLAERFFALAPRNPQAAASVGIARYFAALDVDTEKAAIEFLAERAEENPSALELHLALAKICIDAGAAARASRALDAARKIDANDHRATQLTTALGSKHSRRRTSYRPKDILATLRARRRG